MFEDLRREFCNGAVAQLGEHLLCKQGVTGSIPVSSTKHSWMVSAHYLIEDDWTLKSSSCSLKTWDVTSVLVLSNQTCR